MSQPYYQQQRPPAGPGYQGVGVPGRGLLPPLPGQMMSSQSVIYPPGGPAAAHYHRPPPQIHSPALQAGFHAHPPPPHLHQQPPNGFSAPPPSAFVGGFVSPALAPRVNGIPHLAAPSRPPPGAPVFAPPPSAASQSGFRIPSSSGGPNNQIPIPRSPSAPPLQLGPTPGSFPSSSTHPNMPVLAYGQPSLAPGQLVSQPRAASSSHHGHGRYATSDLGHGAPPQPMNLSSSPGNAGPAGARARGRYASASDMGHGVAAAPPTRIVSSAAVLPPHSASSTPANGHRRSSDVGISSSASTGGVSVNSSSTGTAQLTYLLPDLPKLEADRERMLASGDAPRKLKWAAEVMRFVERKADSSKITEAPLVQYIDEAIGIINKQAGGSDPVAEALYLRGDLQASGAFPTYLRKDLRSAFNDFELAARMGYSASWFRIGRDYEVLGDVSRAKIAYDHGATAGDVGSVYRLGMANLLGQLDLPINYPRAIQLLRTAADKADIDTPQPAYIFGMLLAGEFGHVPVPAHLLQPAPPATMEGEARRRIERAAYLNFVPAQHKSGWCYEHARLDCPYDPLLSVQWYSLASQGGEAEADMALSKWFLCGAEGCFDVDESLAFTFADKAARKGLASAEFALGYYFEVGVGVEQDLAASRKWYKKAAAHGDNDAKERIAALDKPAPQTISRRDHLSHVDTKLVHTRTLAKNRSQKAGRKALSEQTANATNKPAPSTSAGGDGIPHDLSRKKTMKLVHETAGVRGGLRRLAGRKPKLEGSEAGPPLTSTQIAPPTMGPPSTPTHNRVASQGYGVSPGSHPPNAYGQGGSGPNTPSRHQRFPSGSGPVGIPPQGPSPMSQPRRPSSDMQASQQLPPPQQQHRPQSHNSNVSHGSSTGSYQSGSTAGPAAKQPVVYESFEQMGFAPQKVGSDKDCVVM